MPHPEEKRILIAVTGSIAAYRTCDLVRSLSKQDYPVQVMMTEAALRLVGAPTFQALSGRPVMKDAWEEGMIHIEAKNIAGVFAVVPASANSIGKFACGIADDFVSSTYLALRCPVLVAPAMNPGMFESPAVQRNLATLVRDGVEVLDPSEGEVVCGDVGRGKMAAVSDIERAIVRLFLRQEHPERTT